MKYFSILLAAVVLSASSLDAQVLSGRDAFVVRNEPRTLRSGYQLPATALVVTRPQAGTYARGVLLVKTRAIHGVHRDDRTIDGSAANTVLAAAGMQRVTSAFPTADGASDGDAELAAAIGLDRIYRVSYSEEIDPFDLCLRLMQAPDVEYAVPVTSAKASFVPNDPNYASKQAWMKTMKMEEAWNVTKGSSDVIIAIVDSGTDWTHEDLAAKIFTNTKEIPNNGVDDDKNGFVDDVRGWDFVGNITLQEASAGVLKPDNDPKVNYPTINGTNGHGTVVAGCAGAHTDNAKGVASTGFNCTILPVKIGSDNPGIGGLFEGYTAIKYAVDMGADVLNCSWGGTNPDPTGQDVINYALAKGAVVVAASGNTGLFTDEVPHYPSSFQGVLGVGSCSTSDLVSGFSNYGYDVTTYAPGEQIFSTFPGNKYQAFDGTSFSCPFVAGICGLIKSIHPNWTPQMVIQQIRATSDQLSGTNGSNRPIYFGRVNGTKAVKYNASFSSGDRWPGITLNNVTVSTGGKIINYDPTDVTIELKNLLGDATNVNILVEPKAMGAQITGGGQTIVPTLLHDSTVRLNMQVKLPATYPWFEANVQFLITIQSGFYVNYVMVNVPVELPSRNEHQLVPSSAYSGGYYHVDMTTDGVLWVATDFSGQPALITGTQTSNKLVPAPFAPTAVCGVAGLTAIVGGSGSGSKPTIAITRNAQSWTSTDVSSLMSSVTGIAMFNAKEGIAVGNPVGGKIGMAQTTDGGTTWNKIFSAPSAANGETLVAHAMYSSANAIWFATSNRRVFYSLNKGVSWASTAINVNGASILSLAFPNDQNGVMIYEVGGKRWGATSTNNGAWKAQAFDPTTLNIKGACVASPGKHVLLVGTNGEVFGSDNLGTDWQPVLSKPPGEVVTGVARDAGITVLATIGKGIGILAYYYSGPNGSKILTAASDTMDFGALQSSQNRLRSVRLENSGESDVTVDSVTITLEGTTPAEAFRVINSPTVVNAGSSASLSIRMYATDTGSYRAIAKVYSNAQGSPLQVTMVGSVSPATGVEEQVLSGGFGVWPNPAADRVTVDVSVPVSVYVIDAQGRMAASYGELQTGSRELTVSDLAPGLYMLVFTDGRARHSVPLRIMR
jgi:hypothetical protein